MTILDFEKAFDKVAHTRLTHKLCYYGIRGGLLQSIQSFLTNCTQRVVVDGACSSPCRVTSGVPQGSVLDSFLFFIYVNDITSNIHSQLRLFADDCVIYHPINSPQDHMMLQDDLLKLSALADVWQRKFNVKKCCIPQVSTRDKSILLLFLSVFLSGNSFSSYPLCSRFCLKFQHFAQS